jgi:hypothetical protein
MRQLNVPRGFAAAALALTLSSCVSLGPTTIRQDRTLYNSAVQQTEAQQLLLNIVRQRYNDPVLFLDVTSITSSKTRTASASLSAMFPKFGFNSSEGEVGGEFEDSPVISYAPNNGEKFVTQMLTPLDLRTITLMLQSGWSIERVMLVTGDSLNGVPNAKLGALVSALRELQRTGDLTLGVEAGTGDDDVPKVTLLFSDSGRKSAAYLTVCQGFGVSCDASTITLRQGVGVRSGDATVMTLATRSLFSAMFFLAQGVEVPADDDARGIAVKPSRDWGPEKAELFRVLSSRTEPKDAHVKVNYRDAWFYIADTDADSKTTFALMNMLLMLQAGDPERATPLLTLGTN